MPKKYFFNILFLLFVVLSPQISSGKGMKYCLYCASNANMSQAAFLTYNAYVMEWGKWKITGASTTNIPIWYNSGCGTLDDQSYGNGTYYISFQRVQDFYLSPTETRVIADNYCTHTNFYAIYTNSLSIVVTGLTAGASAAWQLAAFPDGEFTNSTCYLSHESGSYTGNVALTMIPTGTYSFTFEQKKGYYATPATNVNVTGALYDWYSTNCYVAYSNNLSVVAAGVESGSNVVWSLTALNSEFTNTAVCYGLQFTNDYTLSLIPTGVYTIAWPEMLGYTTPATTATNITELSPLVNVVTGLYTPVVWGNNTNEPWTNPPSGALPTNFPAVGTNPIVQMVDTNGGWQTPSKEKVIAANGLATTNDIATSAANLATHVTDTNPHSITPGLIGAVPITDTLYGTIGLSMTNYVSVVSTTNWLSYDPITRLFAGCVTNENTGPQGETGPQGPAGTNGADGATGPQGPQGPAGMNGLDGATGPQGPAGTNGADGATGPQGPAGTNGTDGLAATISVVWTSNGVPESAAIVTNVGSSNAASFGFVIPVGSTGATGPQGPAGTNGVDGTNGTDGATGPQGPQGEQGLQGPAGTNGADGATGPQGPAGPVTNQLMAANGVLYTITNTPSAGQVIKFNPATSNAWFADTSATNAYQAFTSTLTPDAGGTCTVTFASGPLVKIYQPATNITLTFDNTDFLTSGVSRVGVEIYSLTNSVAFSTATITNATTPIISTSDWTSLFFRRVGNGLWKGRQ